MPKKRPNEILRRKEKVRAAVALRGVPEGTRGRVMMSVGIDWIRYWVSFDNGVDMSSISRDQLVRVDEWDRYLATRAAAAARPAGTAGATGAVADGADGDGGGVGGAVVNGVAVPQLLIDRSNAALARFGVSR